MTSEETTLLARLDERVTSLMHSMDALRVEVEHIKQSQEAFGQQAAKWRGGLALLVAIGSFAVGAVAIVDKVMAITGKR